MTNRDLAGKAALFQTRISAIQAGLPNAGFEWYPYDSLGNLFNLARVLGEERQFLLDLIGDSPVLDIGCGDGHVAFFLESLGCKVTVVDNPVTNHNRMQGVRMLKAALNSTIEIYERDIDYEFNLPDAQFGVTFFLGVLYHLKNPFGALETLARHSRYCILSTRVTRFGPDKSSDLSGFPVAYLVHETETNNDATNYWIFTNLGLKRLIDRSGWRVAGYATVGNLRDSDPVSAEGDERAFCLVERKGLSITNGELLSGWYREERLEAWLWTEKRFSVAFTNVSNAPHVLSLEFFLPDAKEKQRSLELGCAINGHKLPQREFAKSGHHKYEEPVPDTALAGSPVIAEFTVNNAFPSGEHDLRELGIIVASVRLV
jgi:tRNA (mo5U34)-methyltransferase